MVPNDTASGGAAQPSAAPAPAKPPTPPWPDWLTAAGSAFCAWLMRPRVRLTLIGALLLLVGGVFAPNTVWTLPVVIVGALMVAVAWIGRRLEGRFAVEWGAAGTQLAFRASIKAAQLASDMPALAAGASEQAAGPVRVDPAALGRASDGVIEGEAHTVEINVGELKALIAAAETAEAGAPRAADVRDIRIRRLSDETDRTPRPAG
jgi:hypothetical protein